MKLREVKVRTESSKKWHNFRKEAKLSKVNCLGIKYHYNSDWPIFDASITLFKKCYSLPQSRGDVCMQQCLCVQYNSVHLLLSHCRLNQLYLLSP